MAQLTRPQFAAKDVRKSAKILATFANLHPTDYGPTALPTLSNSGTDHGAITVKATRICFHFLSQAEIPRNDLGIGPVRL